MGAPWTTALQQGRLVVALVRHGQTEWNASKRFVGRTDIPLDATGHQQARTLAAGLDASFDAMYSSPLQRALQTAHALAPPQPVVLPGLAELDQGELEGLTGEEAHRRFPDFFEAWRRDPTSVACPGGEGLQDCRDRAWAELEHIRGQHANGLVAAAAHQVVISALSCTVLDVGLGGWREHFVGNTAITALSFGPGGWRVEVEDWRVGA